MRLALFGVVTFLFVGCAAAPLAPGDSGAGGSGADAGARDGGGGGGGQVDAGLPLKSACTVLNARRCEYLRRCGLISEPAVRDCLAWQQATSCGPAKWQARVEPPVATLRYDGLIAQLCADGWAARACTDFSTEPGACSRYLLPNAFATQACYDGYSECTEPSTYVCRGTACPRSCQPKGSAGDVCREAADCKSPMFCKVTNLATGAGLCTPYGQQGSTCEPDLPCLSSPDGLVCSGGKCALPPPANQPCLGSICDSSAWCLSGADGGQCKPRVGATGSCTDDAQCQAQLLCEVLTGKCAPRQLSSPGSVCGLRQTCPAGAVCVGATPTSLGECQSALDAGAGCVSSNDCQGHLACIGLDGGLALGCGPRQPDGMRCAENRDCQLLSICKQLTCVRLPTTGDSCAVAGACLFGPCVSTDGGPICSEPFGPGIGCTKDSDCSSSRCVTGKCLPSCTP